MDTQKGETVRSKMIRLMVALISVAERIAQNENAKPEEIAALPGIANSVVNITAYAVIEPKGTTD